MLKVRDVMLHPAGQIRGIQSEAQVGHLLGHPGLAVRQEVRDHDQAAGLERTAQLAQRRRQVRHVVQHHVGEARVHLAVRAG